MHLAWKLYIDFVSGQPGIKFIEVDPMKQWLFWICTFSLGMLSGALILCSLPRGMPALLWRVSSVGILLAVSTGFCVLKFRWEMRDMVAMVGTGGLYSTQMVPVLPVFLPAILLCLVYLMLLAMKTRRGRTMPG